MYISAWYMGFVFLFQMVEVAVNLVEQLQCEVATPSEARHIPGISG